MIPSSVICSYLESVFVAVEVELPEEPPDEALVDVASDDVLDEEAPVVDACVLLVSSVLDPVFVVCVLELPEDVEVELLGDPVDEELMIVLVDDELLSVDPCVPLVSSVVV